MAEFRVILCDDPLDTGLESEITLPFPPFPGLWLRWPHRKMDYNEADCVYWDDERQAFVVFNWRINRYGFQEEAPKKTPKKARKKR